MRALLNVLIVIAMMGDSVVLIDLRVQSLLKGQLPNVANVSVELSAVTLSSMFLCHHQSCYPIGSIPYEIRSSWSAHLGSSYSAPVIFQH
jgi:hypothetical protein